MAYEIVPLKIVVNTQDDGEYFVLVGSHGEIFLALDDVVKLGLPPGEVAVRLNGISYASLSAYRPKLNFKLDENTSALLVNAEPSLFSKTVVDLGSKETQPNALGIDTAFLNYAFIRRDLSDGTYSTLDVPLESVVNAHGFVFRANYGYHQDPDKISWTHSFTSVSRDFPQNLTRFVLGDFSANSGDLGGGGLYGGINYGKSFSMAPALITFPGLAVSGVLETPSQVDIYVNNALLSSERLPAGSFELNNVPSIYGGGEATVVIKDAFGRERRETLPVYISSRLLNTGLHDFNYSLGLSRTSTYTSTVVYDSSPTLLGRHRVGITRALTGGLRFEAADRFVNAGPTVDFLLGGWGEMEAGAAGSQDADRPFGYAGYLRYFASQRYTQFRFSVQAANPDYTTVSSRQATSRLHVTKNVGVGLQGLPVGAVSLGWDTIRRYGEVPEREISLNYTLSIGRRSTALVRLSRQFKGPVTDDVVWLSFNMSFGRQLSSGASYTKEEESFSRNLSVQKATPIGPGFGFRLQAADTREQARAGEWTGDANVQYKARSAAFSAGYFKSSNLGSSEFSMAGALAFIDNDFYLGRPIRDSFSLVKVGDLDNVRVYYSSESLGATHNGKLLVPNLASYGRNSVSIEPQDVPIDFSLSSIQQYVAPTYRSGAVANFDVARFQGFTGHLYLRDKQRRWPAEYAGLVLTDKAGSVSSTVGQGGEFYFENMRPGKYVGRVTLERKQCDFPLNVAASKEMVVQLGEVTCDL